MSAMTPHLPSILGQIAQLRAHAFAGMPAKPLGNAVQSCKGTLQTCAALPRILTVCQRCRPSRTPEEEKRMSRHSTCLRTLLFVGDHLYATQCMLSHARSCDLNAISALVRSCEPRECLLKEGRWWYAFHRRRADDGLLTKHSKVGGIC